MFLDTETYSEVPLAHGTSRYAEEAEVIIISKAFDNGAAVSTPCDDVELYNLEADIAEAEEIVIQNSFFDRTVLRVAHGIEIPIAKIRDSMVLAYQHSLPGGLGVLCDILKVPQELSKEKDGRQLIHLFCKPQSDGTRATAATHPDQWAKFLNYARLDTEAMREVFKRLPRWNDSPFERALWQLDQAVNDYGLLIDEEFARAAVAAVSHEKRRLDEQTDELTYGDVRSGTQRAKLLAHLLAFYGVALPDMQAGTLEKRLEDTDIPWPVRELIGLRLSSSTTSTAKYNRALKALSRDGRLRGTLQYGGAWRTLRWAGRIFQPHNLPRPTLKPYSVIAEGIEAIKAGVAQFVVEDVMRLASSALRGLPVAPPGKKLCIADLSSIESRMLSFLAGEEWKLQAFRDFDAGTGHDTYRLTYANSFHVEVGTVDEDQRQVGKVEDLSLGYQGSVGAFATMMTGYGVYIPEEQILPIVNGWRQAHPNIVAFWYALDDAARAVIEDRAAVVQVGRIRVDRIGGWMRMRLPSGRYLSYPAPAIKFMKCLECEGRGRVIVTLPETEFTDEIHFPVECERCKGNGGKLSITYMGMNPYTKKWGRIASYGGKFAENLTQAASRDVMGCGMLAADAAGYDIVLTVHDELVTETEDNELYSAAHLAHLMTRPLEWAPGLPLAAKGFECYRYRKE